MFFKDKVKKNIPLKNIPLKKTCNKCHIIKNETFKKTNNAKSVQIDHAINHMILDNHNKIQKIIYNTYLTIFIYTLKWKKF